MKIESPLLGALEVTDDKVIEFPAGLPGFEQCRRFVLVHEEGGAASVFLLQSIEDPEVAFSLTGPEQLGVTYEFPLTDEDVAVLQLARPEDALVAIIIRREDDDPATAGLRANFMAPVVINVGARRGLQKVINKFGCDIILRAQG